MPMALVEGVGASAGASGLIRTSTIERPQTPPGIMAGESVDAAREEEVEAVGEFIEDDDLADSEDDDDQEEGEDMPTATGATRTRRAPTHGSRLDAVEADGRATRDDVAVLKADVGAVKTDVGAVKTDVAAVAKQNTQIIQMLTSFGMTPPPADGSGGGAVMAHSGPGIALAMRMVTQALGPLGTVIIIIYLLATGKIH